MSTIYVQQTPGGLRLLRNSTFSPATPGPDFHTLRAALEIADRFGYSHWYGSKPSWMEPQRIPKQYRAAKPEAFVANPSMMPIDVAKIVYNRDLKNAKPDILKRLRESNGTHDRNDSDYWEQVRGYCVLFRQVGRSLDEQRRRDEVEEQQMDAIKSFRALFGPGERLPLFKSATIAIAIDDHDDYTVSIAWTSIDGTSDSGTWVVRGRYALRNTVNDFLLCPSARATWGPRDSVKRGTE